MGNCFKICMYVCNNAWFHLWLSLWWWRSREILGENYNNIKSGMNERYHTQKIASIETAGSSYTYSIIIFCIFIQTHSTPWTSCQSAFLCDLHTKSQRWHLNAITGLAVLVSRFLAIPFSCVVYRHSIHVIYQHLTVLEGGNFWYSLMLLPLFPSVSLIHLSFWLFI